MGTINILISILAALVIFLFSLKGFSKEIQDIGANALRNKLINWTQNKWLAFFSGIFITSIIQSSSAVSSIIVALVDSNLIAFSNSIPILIGSNVGTTFTAWLIAFKIENLGSVLIIVGTLISSIPHRMQIIGKSIFYLGLILFSLQLIHFAIKPLKELELFIYILSLAKNVYFGILIGATLTTILQSSSVVTGLAIVLASQGMLNLEGAIAIAIGANIGTTSTALIASFRLNKLAQKTAKVNAFFNIIGVLLFLPLFTFFTEIISNIQIALEYQIALAHMFFNITTALFFMLFLNKINKYFHKL
jgi:phosphate:Na+ symporter